MTAKDSAHRVLRNITAAGVTTAWKIINYVLDGCGLTHAWANLQEVGNLGDEAGLMYA